jgi:hypothetical protein
MKIIGKWWKNVGKIIIKCLDNYEKMMKIWWWNNDKNELNVNWSTTMHSCNGRNHFRNSCRALKFWEHALKTVILILNYLSLISIYNSKVYFQHKCFPLHIPAKQVIDRHFSRKQDAVVIVQVFLVCFQTQVNQIKSIVCVQVNQFQHNLFTYLTLAQSHQAISPTCNVWSWRSWWRGHDEKQ